MNYLVIIGLIFSSLAQSSGAFGSSATEVIMTTKTEAGEAVKLQGGKVVAISAPITMDAGYGRKAILDQYLELNRDCDGFGLVVEQFIDGDALMAYCRYDSGPTVTYMANLLPPSCKEGVLAKDHNNRFVCRVHKVTCTYDYNPYTWKEVAVDVLDNNHGCI